MAFLKVKNLKKYFPVTHGVFQRRKGWVYAVDDISFCLDRGKTLGIVGESGCGKTTLGRCIMGLYPLTSGEVLLEGKAVSGPGSVNIRQLSRKMQMIFQDPFESLDPRQTVGEILKEKYIIHGRKHKDLDKTVSDLACRAGLDRQSLLKFPHEFSGGQRQRIGIARAISMDPEIIICDEPVSALDVSVQSKILNLLLELQQQMGLTYIFISHDLSVVRHVADKIAVMYLGKIVEMADTDDIYNHARHPYTRALLSAIPVPDPEACRDRIILKGELPSVENPPAGCRFNTRCDKAQDICRAREPVLLACRDNPGHMTACHFPVDQGNKQS